MAFLTHHHLRPSGFLGFQSASDLYGNQSNGPQQVEPIRLVAIEMILIEGEHR